MTGKDRRAAVEMTYASTEKTDLMTRNAVVYLTVKNSCSHLVYLYLAFINDKFDAPRATQFRT